MFRSGGRRQKRRRVGYYFGMMRLLRYAGLLLAAAATLPAAKNLEVFFIDVEGGQATLFAPPGGETLLIDTGWGGFNRRDADRIAAAAKAAGVKRIDYLLITHFHTDHVGGVAQLAEKLPIRNFVDHGTNVETGKAAEVLFNTYKAFRAKGNHIQVKPGDKVPVKGLDVTVVSAGGETISTALPGAGQPNPECASFHKMDPDQSENAQSVGVIIQFGDFRMADLGDLTWNKEFDLVCPANKLGKVDAFVVSHHGTNTSNSPQLVRALAPRAAIMENGAKKGGTVEVWRTLSATPGLETWQLHFSVAGGKENNAADPFIANVDEVCEGKWLKMTATREGAFTVENSRNKYQKAYPR
jgi:beta-lactamase superfamily II metal-dependent hydrolase